VRQRYGGAGRRGDQRAGGDRQSGALFPAAGQESAAIADYPGLLVWRTVAMLVNEALDALQKGSPARRISIPPCVWASTTRRPAGVGESLAGAVLRLLENLQHHYGEERYRPCSLLRQKALMEKHHEQ
jgi:3-hydroxybutyryl-CoA dehydrogenase